MNDDKKINIVLAGQGNAGKSTVFNYLTGLHQHIGNWAGKTIEKREGTLFYKGYTIDVVDLPGIYSLATLSQEELLAREYILNQKPDYVVNIVDCSNLERNLVFTLQLLELECPIIIVLNMMDIARKKGIRVDIEKLQEILGVPVVSAIASRGSGLTEIIDRIIEAIDKEPEHKTLKYGREIEDAISVVINLLKGYDLSYPARWIAIKLLEKDSEILKLVRRINPEIMITLEQLWQKLESMHGHDSSVIIADERCHLVSHIVKNAVRISPRRKLSFSERLDILTTHKIAGYLVMALVLGGMFFTIFIFGNWLSSKFDSLFQGFHDWWVSKLGTTHISLLGWSAAEGVLALIQIAFPYILPFYIILYILEGWGYIARISYLMDNFMHKMGIHGKAIIPFIIGLGCNVPGCLACRIMESKRERFITAVLVTLVPCSAVSVIIFGLVGKYVGILWALGLYLLAAIVVFVAGKLSSKLLLGEPVELIMPMPDYKMPNLRTITTQTWLSMKEFIYIAAPIVIVTGILIQAINLAGWMPAISSFLDPVTVKWLGLPSITGILLIFGILRKELILVMLAAYLGTSEFASVLSPVQMITLAVISMFYIPCVATISVLWKEYGWEKALAISFLEIIFAIILAGVVKRILDLVY